MSTTALDAAAAAAAALREKQPGLTAEQALSKVFTDNPDIYVLYEEERRQQRLAPRLESEADADARMFAEGDLATWRAARAAWQRERPGEGETAFRGWAARNMPDLRTEEDAAAALYALDLRS